MRKRLIFAILLTFVAPAAAQDLVNGEAIFQKYCAVCHEMDATGNGPMSPALVLQPPNLTILAEDGVFPRNRVIARIDGRDPLVSHGSQMPIYGDYFEGNWVATRDETGLMIMTSQPIVDLLAWLESVQKD